jgi:hypothetical protein
LLSGYFVPLALTVLAAELYNILAFHLTLAPATIAPALVASVLWSTYPFHLWLTKQPDPTSLFSLLLLLSVFLFVRWTTDGRRSVRYGCLLGLALGIAALIKPIAIALPAVIGGLAWICVIPCRPRHRALFSLCVVVAYLVAISPWEIWARRVSGKWIPLCTNGPSVLIDGLTLGTVRGLKPVTMPQSVRGLTEDAVEHAKQLRTASSVASFLVAKVQKKPAVVARFFLIKATRTWYGNESQSFEKWVVVIQLLYLPFVVFGARVLSRGGRQQRNFLLVVTAITLYFWALTTLTALPVLRYLVPAVSLLLIFAAVAFDALEIQFFQPLFSTGREARIEQEQLR